MLSIEPDSEITYVYLQDTVLGLQALAGYAGLVISDSTNLNVMFSTGAEIFQHNITVQNAIITKKSTVRYTNHIYKITHCW